MDAALREIGVSDTRVPKRMKTLYSSFAGRISAYGQALGEGEEALDAAIARNVFPDGGEDAHVRALSDYAAAAVAAMRAADLADIRGGTLPFPVLETPGPEA